jgi:uncharacterized protein (TIGR03437 family)
MMNRVFSLLIPVVGLAASGFGQYAITTSSLPVAKVGQSYIAAIQTNSAASATFCSIVSGTLPAGLVILTNGTGCSIAGTPSVATAASFAVTVSNIQGETTAARVLSLAVFGITTASVPAANLNSFYNFQFQAGGGSNYQWSVLSGSLPNGLSLSFAGALFGTPLVAGQFPFTVRVVDLGSGLADSRNYVLTVNSSGGQFQIVPSTLPDGAVNQSYSATVQTTGGTGSLNVSSGCSVVSGSLPPGISVTPSGSLCIFSGVPSNPGAYQFQLQAMDSQGQVTAPSLFTINVGGAGSGGGALAITTAFVPNGTTAVPYLPNGAVFYFTASGGTGIYSWTLDSGALPGGLTLNANGTLTGTPTQSGLFSFVVRVVSSGLLTSFQQTTTRSYSMTIGSGGLTIVETTLPTATVGQAYSFQLHASGGTAPYHWRVSNTAIQGITIDFNTGLISGTAQSAGMFAFSVTVSDNAGAQTTVNFSITASGLFSISTTALPAGAAGVAYSQGLQATGGQSPYTWTISSGSLPPGLTMTQSGSINGTPTQNGQFTFTVVATDTAGRTASQILILQIGGPGPVQILTSSLPGGSVGAQYAQTLAASGGQSPYSWSIVTGALPAGLNLNSASGTIAGTPAQGGSFAFAVQVSDAIGNSTIKSFSIAIASSGLVLTPNQLSFGYVIGGSLPAAQQVTLTSSLAQGFTTSTNALWLSVNPPNGTAPTIVTISANPVGLAAGVYVGIVTVTPAGGSDPPQTISVSLNIGLQSGLTVTPPALAFTYQTGGVKPAPQNLFVGSSTGTLSFTSVSSGGGWLSVSPSSGTTPAVVSVSVSPAGLSQGTYTGLITIFGAGVSRQVPVTLIVVGQVAPIVTLSKSSLSFTYQFGGGLPPTQSVALSGTAGVSFAASSGAPWLSVRPDVGITPANLFISVNPTGLSPAAYDSLVTIVTTAANGNTTLTLPVTFTLTSAGFPVITTVVNAASYAAGPVAAGEIVTLGGLSLGPDTPATTTLDASGKVSTALGGVQVLFNGYPAPLTYVSAGQINAVVPYEVVGQQSVQVAVRTRSVTSVPFPLTQTGSAPGVFTLNASGTGPGAILNQDNSVNSPLNPARKGSVVALFVTGEGQTSPPGTTGKVTSVSPTPPITPQPVLPVIVTIAGQTLTPSFTGEAPGFVAGVMQLNVQIPSSVGSGELPIDVSIGGNHSQSGVTVSVQ